MNKKIKFSYLILAIVIVLIIILIFFIAFYPEPANVKIISVNYEKNENTDLFTFAIEIKNIGDEGTVYKVQLCNYRLADTNYLDDTDVASGYLDGGDKTMVTLTTTPTGNWLFFDVEIKIYSRGYTDITDIWYERLEKQ